MKRAKRERYFGEPMDTGRDYRPKYLCFNCRKVRRVLRSRKQKNIAIVCGHCGGPLYPVNPMFKPPKANTRKGIKGWTEIKKGYKFKLKFFIQKRYKDYLEKKNDI